MNEKPRTDGMGGLAKGLAIIEAFSSRDAISIADAARLSGTTRAAARRCLLTLSQLGYVVLDGRVYRALPRLRHLGRQASFPDRLRDVAQPHLDAARDALGESVSIAVLDTDTTLFIARAEAEHIVSTGVRIGARLPAYCSATGRILLSPLPDRDILQRLGTTPLPRRTSHTLTESDAILAEIHHARDAGFAVSDQELELGIRSLAVPIRDWNGDIAAALSVSAFSARVKIGELRKRSLQILLTCAERLTEAACQTA